jgi:hypothetical protein
MVAVRQDWGEVAEGRVRGTRFMASLRVLAGKRLPGLVAGRRYALG